MDDFIALKIYFDRLQAEMAETLLGAAGIPCMLKAADAVGVMPHMARMFGIQLLVNKPDYEKAERLLSSPSSRAVRE